MLQTQQQPSADTSPAIRHSQHNKDTTELPSVKISANDSFLVTLAFLKGGLQFCFVFSCFLKSKIPHHSYSKQLFETSGLASLQASF